MSNEAKTGNDVAGSTSKASIDLFGQALKACIEVLQKLSTAIASKK